MLNSDIKWLYGKVTDLATGAIVAPSLDVTWKDPEKDFQGYGE